MTKWSSYSCAVLALFCGVLSILTTIGELGILLFPNNQFVEKQFRKDLGGFVITNFLILIPLGYLCFCTYYGLFNIKLSGLYELHSNKTSDSGSLVFAAK